jgi:hypothetical protein
MFGTKREEVTGECGELHEKLHDLYPPLNINGVNRSSNIRWAAHVARKGERKSAYRIFVAKLDGKRLLEDLGVDGNTEEDLNEIRYECL